MPVAGIETYHRPPDVDGAWNLLRDGGSPVRLLAGGTDLTVRTPTGVTTLVDLQAAGLRWIDNDADGLHVGAMSTFTDLLEHPAVRAHAGGVLVDLLAGFGSVLHRNLGTIGGHLARARMSDLVPTLLALDASVDVHTDRPATLSLADYLAGPQATSVPHLVTAVHLPASPPGAAAAFERFTRSAYDHALVNACAWVATDGAAVTEARITVGQSGGLGRRLVSAEGTLTDGRLDDEHIVACAAVARDTFDARGDGMASEAFRRHLAGVLVERCLRSVVTRLGGGQP